MSDAPPPSSQDLCSKISRLVQERGWNDADFARIANLNRQTVHQIMHEGGRKLRNVTVSRCARALGLPVLDLRTQPVERLLQRMNGQLPASDAALQRLYEEATQPQLLAWLERNPERARQLSSDEIDELLSLQGTGGPLTTFGVEHFVDLIERKRKLIQKVHAICGTEYLDFLEKFVSLLHEKIQPYSDRR
jgi:transcriptional regulator with XRE-family HTH domain